MKNWKLPNCPTIREFFNIVHLCHVMSYRDVRWCCWHSSLTETVISFHGQNQVKKIACSRYLLNTYSTPAAYVSSFNLQNHLLRYGLLLSPWGRRGHWGSQRVCDVPRGHTDEGTQLGNQAVWLWRLHDYWFPGLSLLHFLTITKTTCTGLPKINGNREEKQSARKHTRL